MYLTKSPLFKAVVLSSACWFNTALANPFHDVYVPEYLPEDDDPVEVGSDSIIIDDIARKAMEEEEKQAVSISGAYAAFDAPIAKNNNFQDDSQSATIGQFSFRLSAGYGLIENPLLKRDDIEVYLLPEFSYYGENFYVENFVLGYSLLETDRIMFDVFGYFNEDGYFFELDGIKKITVATILGRQPNNGLLIGSPIEPKNLERDLSYLGGFNTTYRGDWVDIQMSVATDVSDVHNGQEAKLKFIKRLQLGNWRASMSATTTMKSSQINDYYYLVKDGEFTRKAQKGSLGSTVTHKAELHLGYQFTSRISANLLLQKTWLDEGLKNPALSPLVEDLSYYSGFVGLTYRF